MEVRLQIEQYIHRNSGWSAAPVESAHPLGLYQPTYPGAFPKRWKEKKSINKKKS